MMNARLTLTQIAILILYAAGMVGGQFLFKLASLRMAPDQSVGDRLLALLQNGFFLVAVALYAALSVLWVWLLSFTPLSRAYPFVALAFVVTPIAGAFAFSEPLTLRLLAGLMLILGGLFLVAG